MFGRGRRKSSASSIANFKESREDEHQLSASSRSASGSGRGSLTSTDRFAYGGPKSTSQHNEANYDEQEHFLAKNNNNKKASAKSAKLKRRKAKLAREETVEEESASCYKMILKFVKQKRIFIPIIIISFIAAIYCIPYIEIEPRIPKQLPYIPFNFRDGPLHASSASKFKIEHLFRDQISGAESVALDSAGNMYMAIEGGFILYAHLNKSSPPKRSYYENSIKFGHQSDGLPVALAIEQTDLVKIAELNGIKQLPYEHRRRTRDGTGDGSWRRECHLDEKIYGPNLYSNLASLTANEFDTSQERSANKKFVSHVIASRCSKPLGIRLSPDENYLYVIDTLSGLYRVSLKVPDKPYSTQRLVTRLVDFRTNKRQLLPVTQLDLPDVGSQQTQSDINNSPTVARAKSYLNISLLAVDDLVIEYGAGSRGGDIIYMTVGSQRWIAVSFIYDLLEGKPSGVVVRYDTGSNQLSVLNPNSLAQVRTSSSDLVNVSSRLYSTFNISNNNDVYMGIGAPRLDENDIFDDRPLHFPNGLEITDDRQAILIADSSNKRIIKHYIRGARKGTSDLWAWTPNFPDNIRRGYDKRQETYWVTGCGQDTNDKIDLLSWLRTWPRLRKYILKNIYLFGWFIEIFGTHLMRSTSVRDFGYLFKIGASVIENMCPGMMILQYNSYGDIIRSIYSKEFPNDLFYYSQANEIIDTKTQEHLLYLSSPSYKYVTKLTLPTDSFDLSS